MDSDRGRDGVPEKGEHLVGVVRQYAGTVERIETCQVGSLPGLRQASWPRAGGAEPRESLVGLVTDGSVGHPRGPGGVGLVVPQHRGRQRHCFNLFGGYRPPRWCAESVFLRPDRP